MNEAVLEHKYDGSGRWEPIGRRIADRYSELSCTFENYILWSLENQL